MATQSAKLTNGKIKNLQARRRAPLMTPTDLDPKAVKAITAGLNMLLADVYTLYFKTKNFHWHISGPHFREYHLMLDEQAAELLAMTDVIAERVRKVGGGALKSLAQIVEGQRIMENEADYVEAQDMLAELQEDNRTLVRHMRGLHDLVSDVEDYATTSLIEAWIDETERRTWFLFESTRGM